MRSTRLLAAGVVLGVCWPAASPVAAQQVTVTTPYHSLGDSFFEQMGTSWGLDWNNGFLRVGGPNMASPPFGNPDPSAGLSGGFYSRRDGLSGFFNYTFGQGYRQNFVTQAPSVTLMNGQPGFISDTSQSPFVISYIPIVGGFPTVGYVNPPMLPPDYSTSASGNWRVEAMRQKMAEAQQAVDKQEALRRGVQDATEQPAMAQPGAMQQSGSQPSSATQAVPSVAEARRLHEMEQSSGNNEAMVLLERGRTAEEAGKPNVAKIYYKMAAQRATGELRDRIQARLDAVSSAGNP